MDRTLLTLAMLAMGASLAHARDDGQISGVIQALPQAGLIGQWKVADRQVFVAATTRLRQELGPASVGACVDIKGQIRPDNGLDASEIGVTSSSGGCAGGAAAAVALSPTEFYGIVQKLPVGGLLGDWQIGGRTVRVGAATQVNQSNSRAVLGTCSVVKGLGAGTGTVDAARIELQNGGCGDTGSYHDDWLDIRAVVESAPVAGVAGEWRVGGRTVRISAATRINQVAGGLAVGACVDARGPYQPDGSLTAAAVDVKGSADCAFNALYGSDDAFETLGPIRQLPASGTAGDWQIGNTLVRVWSFTEIDVEYGDLGLGVCVSAKGSLLRDNSMLADTIEVKSVPGTCIGPHGVVSAASFENSRVSPGEMVSIFGFGVGPAMPVGMWRLDDGRASTSAGNVRVLFDGVAAPVVFATMNQINVVTPWSVSGKTVTQVQVEYDGVWSNTILIPVVESRPALFTADGSGRGQGIFLNQNGTSNSAANPAAKGSVVVLFGTGAGQYTRAMDDGEFIVDASVRPLMPVTAFVGGMPAEVLYAGGAPNMIAGIFQVNVRIPDAVPAGAAVPVVVRAGTNDSKGGVTLAIH